MGRDNHEEEFDTEHPALKGYSRIGTQAKSVVGKSLKYGLIGGLGGAAVLGGAAAAGAAGLVFLSGPIGWAGAGLAAITGIGMPAAGAALSSFAVAGATYGAAVGAASGGIMGIVNADEAADAQEDKLINKYEQAMARQQRMDRLRDARDRQMMAMERQAGYMGQSQNPNVSLPRNNTPGRDGMAYS